MITTWNTPEGLVKGFYNSFADEETFTGTDETLHWARAIVDAGDQMWNWPSVVTDAEAYIAQNV